MRDMAKRRAWVKYDEMRGEPGVAIMVKVSGDWGLDSFWPLVAKKDGHTDFVHWAIFRRLAHIQNLGYEIEFY